MSHKKYIYSDGSDGESIFKSDLISLMKSRLKLFLQEEHY